MHIAAAHGMTATIEYTREFATTVNDPNATEIAARAARDTVGIERCDGQTPPIMASEDFGLYGEHVPANFTLIGNGSAGSAGGVPLHSHDYEFNDDILQVGVDYYLRIVRESGLGLSPVPDQAR